MYVLKNLNYTCEGKNHHSTVLGEMEVLLINFDCTLVKLDWRMNFWVRFEIFIIF